MAVPAENSEVKEFEDYGDDSSIRCGGSVTTVSEISTFTIEFGTIDKGPSLQDAFLQYKKKRQNEIKRARKKKEMPDEFRLKAMANPDRMWNLRMKFLEQAKKYFGVPYAKKYWKQEDPEYHSKIFLDCCGLVRRCVKDLRKDFGFKIGPWNQGYQFDTLPISLTEDEMKPGDLVFISATYFNPKMKKQAHNMTHVEIWLGDGPKTIGSRWNKGHVQVFDSYAFEAKSYHSPTYHFKSIDTWLMGICRSHCKDHAWRTRAERLKLSKKSIFSVNSEEKKIKQQQQSDSQNSAASAAAQQGYGDASSPKSSKLTKKNKRVKKGRAKKKPTKNKKNALKEPDDDNDVDGGLLNRLKSDLSLPSTPGSTFRDDVGAFNQIDKALNERVAEGESDSEDGVDDESAAVDDGIIFSDVSSSTEDQEDEDCNATAEEDDENQVNSPQETNEKSTNVQSTDLVTKEGDVHTDKFEADADEENPLEYTVAHAQIELGPVSLPLMDLNMTKKSGKQISSKQRLGRKYVDKENTDNTTDVVQTKGNGANIVPNLQTFCDIRLNSCDEPEDDDKKNEDDDGGASSGSSNGNEGVK